MKRICILGSGAGGGILALELSRFWPGEICIIDIDSNDKKYSFKKKLNNKFISKINHKNNLGFGFGGGSNVWHGVITTLDMEDNIAINKIARTNIIKDLNSGIEELKKYFPKLEMLLKKNSISVRSRKIINERVLTSKKYLVYYSPLRIRKLLQQLQVNTKIKIVEESVALKLNQDDFGNVKSITYLKDKKFYNLEADIFILAMGAIENSRILLQSFSNSVHKNDCVGKNLLDHPFALIGKISTPRALLYKLHGCSSFFKTVSLRFGYKNTCHTKKEKEDGSNHSIFIKPLYAKNVLQQRKIIKKMINRKISYSSILNIFSTKSLLKAIFILILEKLGFGYFTNNFDVSMQFEMTGKDKNTVKLSKYYDIYGRLIPLVNYKIPQRYYLDIKKMQEKVKNSIIAWSDYKFFNFKDILFYTGYHYSGTCQLGTSAKKSVVDINLKYHGIKNLYICDSSIIPRIGNANLFLTISLFSIRLAKYLLNKYK